MTGVASIDFSLFQLAVFGFFGGMGTTLGTKIGEAIFLWAKQRLAGNRRG